jgi:hypothetical protein
LILFPEAVISGWFLVGGEIKRNLLRSLRVINSLNFSSISFVLKLVEYKAGSDLIICGGLLSVGPPTGLSC